VLAFNLSSWPVTVISTTIRKVALPAFARLVGEHPAGHAEDVLVRVVGLLVLVSGVLCALLGSLAGPLVHVVYGERWDPAVSVLRWLAVMGAARVITEIVYDFLIAVGRQQWTLRLQLAWTVLAGVALVVCTRIWGVVGAGAAQAVVGAVMVVAYLAVALAGSAGRVGSLVRRCLPGAGAATAAVAAGIGAQSMGLSDVPALLLGGPVALLAALVVLLPARRELAVVVRGLRG